MADLIDRQAAIDALGNAGLINYAATGSSNGLIHAMNVIKGLPAAQPQRMRGRWNWHEDEDICNCSKCDFEINAEGCVDPYEYVKIYNFCPNCGADMRGEQDE